MLFGVSCRDTYGFCNFLVTISHIPNFSPGKTSPVFQTPSHTCQKDWNVLIFHYLLLVVHYFPLFFLICRYFTWNLCFTSFPCLSLFFLICHYLSWFSPYLSLFFLICHYLSLFVPIFQSPYFSLCVPYLSLFYHGLLLAYPCIDIHKTTYEHIQVSLL